MPTSPFVEVAACDSHAFESLRREVVFEGAKWDPQIGDTSTIARAPLVLRRAAWDELVRLATALSAELRALERAVLADPAALRELGMGGRNARAIQGAPHAHAIALERFDFHFTDEGWRISEVNADVPGGLHEGVVGRSYARRWPRTEVPGDPAAAIAAAFRARCAPGSTIALVHATAYSDDRQVVTLVERALADVGLVGVPCAPDHVRFGPTRLVLGRTDRPVAGIYRFFPAEWLPNLPKDSQPYGFVRPDVPTCNPATALAVQSKRLPLVWDRLGVAVPTFRAVLAETRAVHRAPIHHDDRWLVKPSYGRVGGGIVSLRRAKFRDAARTLLEVARAPRDFVAQRRFTTAPFRCEGETRTACVGVFTLDGRVVGAYGRSTSRPIVDHLAVDTPVLVEAPAPSAP